MTSSRFVTMPLAIIAAILTVAAMKVAAPLLAPMVLALITGVILSPAIAFLLRLGLPRSAAAGGVLAFVLVAFTVLALLFEPVLWRALEQLPFVWQELQETLRQFQDALRGLNQMTEDVKEAISPDAVPGMAGADNGGESAVALPSAIDAIALAPTIAAQLMIFTGVLFFFLFTRDSVYTWGAKALGGRAGSERERYKSSLMAAEHMVSRYFITITLINACLGVAVAVAMTLLGMTSPILWGVAAFAVNFVPYLGPAIFATVLLLGGIVSFDGVMAVMPVGIYLCMNVTEGQFVTPSLVGKTLKVNPLLIFLSLVFFLWVWGPLGGFVAIPVLLWLLLVADLMKPDEALMAVAKQRQAEELEREEEHQQAQAARAAASE
ncbi:AI-2E family transporter [Oceanicola sp. 502str15]|uniref:AI-2E family transporter n=1 Tax=Oceanicola sp. 502str15 TaxID=2696061 RepID=UPI002095DA2B|nr:AI-2E family transporter [Oceanicola sp. 502str15]MCO6381828.1 AI-2E family transporter [Oceanicola sp. 502str15]